MSVCCHIAASLKRLWQLDRRLTPARKKIQYFWAPSGDAIFCVEDEREDSLFDSLGLNVLVSEFASRLEETVLKAAITTNLEITFTYLPSKEDYFRFLYNKENTVIRRSEIFPMGLSVRQSVGLSVCHTASLSQFLKGTNWWKIAFWWINIYP